MTPAERQADRARRVRERFAAFERSTYGSEWSVQELLLGLCTDVGDLAAAVQRFEGRRPTESSGDDRAAVEHELADCLWVLLVVAGRYGIDLERAFEETKDRVEAWLDDRS